MLCRNSVVDSMVGIKCTETSIRGPKVVFGASLVRCIIIISCQLMKSLFLLFHSAIFLLTWWVLCFYPRDTLTCSPVWTRWPTGLRHFWWLPPPLMLAPWCSFLIGLPSLGCHGTSLMWMNMAESLGVKAHWTTAYHPWSNSLWRGFMVWERPCFAPEWLLGGQRNSCGHFLVCFLCPVKTYLQPLPSELVFFHIPFSPGELFSRTPLLQPQVPCAPSITPLLHCLKSPVPGLMDAEFVLMLGTSLSTLLQTFLNPCSSWEVLGHWGFWLQPVFVCC